MYTASGHIVYMAGAVAIVYRKTGHMQQFYSAHTDDIISLALHPDNIIVATGQVRQPDPTRTSSETLRILPNYAPVHDFMTKHL